MGKAHKSQNNYQKSVHKHGEAIDSVPKEFVFLSGDWDGVALLVGSIRHWLVR